MIVYFLVMNSKRCNKLHVVFQEFREYCINFSLQPSQTYRSNYRLLWNVFSSEIHHVPSVNTCSPLNLYTHAKARLQVFYD